MLICSLFDCVKPVPLSTVAPVSCKPLAVTLVVLESVSTLNCSSKPDPLPLLTSRELPLVCAVPDSPTVIL